MSLDREALSEKYAALLALARERREAVESGRARFDDGARETRRGRMREVAQRFPGALRELDALTEAALEHRFEAVRSGRDEPWMWAVMLMHAAIRDELERRANGGASAPGRLMDGVWQRVAGELGCTPDEAERIVFTGAV